MKIFIANESKQAIGGGFTFLSGFKSGLKRIPGVEISPDVDGADICFVASPTMIDGSMFEEMKNKGKKVVLRLDNVVKNSRNRGAGMSRFTRFANNSDLVIWQCHWAKDYLGDLVSANIPQRVIYNGIDTQIFRPDGPVFNLAEYFDEEVTGQVYLYTRYNKQDTKNWPKAWYEFQLAFKKAPADKKPVLVIVGQLDQPMREAAEYGWDFFRGEQVAYLGVIDDQQTMAAIYRASDCLLATYYNDCYPNTYLEAALTGVELVGIDYSGGVPELMENLKTKPFEDWFTNQRMANEYVEAMKAVLGGENLD